MASRRFACLNRTRENWGKAEKKGMHGEVGKAQRPLAEENGACPGQAGSCEDIIHDGVTTASISASLLLANVRDLNLLLPNSMK